MRILVVGSGGREHALVWKLKQEAELFASPGNAGIAKECETFDVKATDMAGIETLSKRLAIDLVVIGPEDPLIQGLADRLRSTGISVFGPNSDAAQLEGSKAFSKTMMREAGVPTADFQVFCKPSAAAAYARERFYEGKQVAVKASGAALGKGVVVCSSIGEAEEAVGMMMVDKALGDAGEQIVIEDRLSGREFSLLTLVCGTNYQSLPVAQDYKRALDGDRGPNTGGMGTYSPVPWVSEDLVKQTERSCVEPLLKALTSKGINYHGVLFTGLMVDSGQPYVLEYNVRFGDPETQSVVRCLGNGFADALMACANELPMPTIELTGNAAVTVVLASGGYPGKYAKGVPIEVGELPQGVKLFHAGTAIANDKLVTDGGRVLGVSAIGNRLSDARELAYRACEAIYFEGMHKRHDIAIDID